MIHGKAARLLEKMERYIVSKFLFLMLALHLLVLSDFVLEKKELSLSE